VTGERGSPAGWRHGWWRSWVTLVRRWRRCPAAVVPWWRSTTEQQPQRQQWSNGGGGHPQLPPQQHHVSFQQRQQQVRPQLQSERPKLGVGGVYDCGSNAMYYQAES
ncbi:unnamed protein product, partial [Pylaiella littoralis]